MHAPGICVEAEHEVKGVLYANGDIKGVVYDTKEVAGSDQLYVYGGFQAKNREFIDAVKQGTQPSSNFADAFEDDGSGRDHFGAGIIKEVVHKCTQINTDQSHTHNASPL